MKLKQVVAEIIYWGVVIPLWAFISTLIFMAVSWIIDKMHQFGWFAVGVIIKNCMETIIITALIVIGLRVWDWVIENRK